MKTEPVLEQLASSLGKRDEVPNIELAEKIVAANNAAAVKVLVENLSNKNKDIQSDCIKVLYEIGARQPALIANYIDNFAALLNSKNNRLQWGAMTALSAIAPKQPKAVHKLLPQLSAAADKGSVITNDHYVNILIALCGISSYEAEVFPLLLEHLLRSPENQLPMYAEKSLSVIHEKNKAAFIKTLTSRINGIEKDTKRARVEKLLKKLQTKR